MAPLKVLHVLEALQAGAARHVVDVVRHTPGVTHEVAIPRERVGWVTDEAAKQAFRDAGAAIHFVEMRRMPPHPRNAAALIELRRLIGGRQPAVVHGHSSVGGALARLAATARVARFYTPNGIASSSAALRVERWLGRRTDCLIAVSESEAEVASRHRLVAPERIEVIHNGIVLEQPPASVDLRRELGIPASTSLVGCVARLVPQKAPEHFVRMCGELAKHTSAHFLMIGAGPLQGLVDREVSEAGLGDRWHQVHELPGAAGVLGQLDVFVLPSRFEGLPYTPLEAMRAGTPVVLTNVVGSRDTIVDGISGLVVAEGDIAALAYATSQLLTDEALRTRIVAGGRARLESQFDVRLMGERLADLYRRAAAVTR